MYSDYRVGEVLECLRSERDISWTEFSKMTGISRCYMYRLRNGVDKRTNKPISPTIQTLVDIADALGVSRKDFLQQCGYIEE